MNNKMYNMYMLMNMGSICNIIIWSINIFFNNNSISNSNSSSITSSSSALATLWLRRRRPRMQSRWEKSHLSHLTGA